MLLPWLQYTDLHGHIPFIQLGRQRLNFIRSIQELLYTIHVAIAIPHALFSYIAFKSILYVSLFYSYNHNNKTM